MEERTSTASSSSRTDVLLPSSECRPVLLTEMHWHNECFVQLKLNSKGTLASTFEEERKTRVGQAKPRQIHFTAVVNRTPLDAILDTGSTITYVNEDTFRMLKL